MKHLQFLAISFYIIATITGALLFAEPELYLKGAGFSLILYVIYQVATEMYYQQDDEE